METKIFVEFPANLSDEAIRDELEGTGIDASGDHELVPAMDLDVSEFDDRATVSDVTITEVELDAESICITYTVEYDAYYGCKDMNYADAVERSITGARVGNRFTFDAHTPLPKRTTLDEL